MESEIKELNENFLGLINSSHFKEPKDKFPNLQKFEQDENWVYIIPTDLAVDETAKAKSTASDKEIFNQIFNYMPSLEHSYLSRLASSIVTASYAEVESDLSPYDREQFNKIEILELANHRLEERIDILESTVLNLKEGITTQQDFEKITRDSTSIKKLKNTTFNKLLNNDILSYIEKVNISKQMLQTIDIINEIFPDNIANDVHISLDPVEGSGWVTLELLYGNNLTESEERFEIFLKEFINKVPPFAQSLICVIVDPFK